MKSQEIIDEYEAAMFAANEAGYAGMTAEQVIRSLFERAEAAEAKLADLEKQEPKLAYIRRLETEISQLRNRPAPAVNLAELVPDIEPYCHGLWPYGVKALQDYRDVILRNIEEAK